MSCLVFDETGYLRQSSTECDYIVITPQQYSELTNPAMAIDAVEVTSAIAFGFGLVVVLGYLSGYVISLAKTLIRKI